MVRGEVITVPLPFEAITVPDRHSYGSRDRKRQGIVWLGDAKLIGKGKGVGNLQASVADSDKISV